MKQRSKVLEVCFSNVIIATILSSLTSTRHTKVMGSKSKRYNMNKAGTLLTFKMFHKIAFKLLANMNNVLTRSRARSLQVDTNEMLQVEDILKRCIAHFPFFMVKDIFCHESTKKTPVKCVNSSLLKTIVSPHKINMEGNAFNSDDLEYMMTQLVYIALQFYAFGSTGKNTESIQTLTYGSDFLILEPKKVLELEFPGPKRVSCDCPPIFGYMIPLDFFGNLLGHEPCCEIKCAHNSYPNYKQCEVDEYENAEDGSLLKPIGYEVKSKTKMTAENMLVDKLLVTDEADYQIDVPETNIKELAYLEDHNCRIQVSWDSEIAPDDGAHPLLDCPDPDEDIKVSKGLEDFLARAFSEKGTSVILDEKQTMCNPPCSVWCDSLSAKGYDTSHASNAQISGLGSNYGIFKRNLDLIKPVYAITSSTNNPQYLRYNDIRNENENSKVSQKAMKELPTIRQIPINTNVQNNKETVIQSLSSKSRQGYHYDVLDQGAFKQNIYFRQRSRRSTWSFVEDESSLWQYLPDCIPDDNVFRQPSQKGTRDLRRQKSLT